MKEAGTLLFLAVNAGKDYRNREISLILTGIYGISGLGYSLWKGRDFYDFLVPAAIAGMFLALAVVTAGAVGLGDGWILLSLGMMLGTTEYIRMLSIGMLLAAGCGGILLIVVGKNRKTEIPFVPFLLLGYIGGLFL